MSKIGMIGCGKLGLPVALAMSLKGHDVMGHDLDPARMQKEFFAEREVGPNGELSIEPLLRKSSLRFGEIDEVVRHSEIIFVAVQTPHDPRFEGVTRLPYERADFDYAYLVNAVLRLSGAIARYGQERIVVIISTVLPGTLRREILPLLTPLCRLVYNPFFIAMGTTILDFLNPEFVLMGAEDHDAAETLKRFYRTLHSRPMVETSIENAELIKVAYNTFVSMKISYVNALMEVCHKTPGCDVDVVTSALTMASDRLISPKYLRAGMGDGGGCHPRDNIAMSWLARKLELSYDWFENLMLCRERQTEWLAYLAIEECARMGASVLYVLGKAFKPGTNLTVGSPATLLVNMLREHGYGVEQYDPYVDQFRPSFYRAVYVIATQHAEFRNFCFPEGSVVLDPFRYIAAQDGVKIISIGRGKPYEAVDSLARIRAAAGD